MNPEVVYYAIGGVCSLAVAVLGLRKVGRGASSVTEDVDPNTRLINMLDRANQRIDSLEQDANRGKVRMSDVERDLSFEKERADRHEQQIGTLQSENRDLRRQLDLLQRAVAAWETWHRWLVSKWHELRQSETPPDGPQAEAAD